MSLRRIAAAIALVGSASGCSPAAPSAQLSEFTSAISTTRPGNIGAVAYTSQGVIGVVGGMHLPNGCQTITATVTHRDRIELRVITRSQGEVCTGIVMYAEYRATMRDLPAGRYDLIVVHEYKDHSEVALLETVRVL